MAATQIFAVLSGAVLWPLLARRLGAQGYSRYQSVQVIGTLLGYGLFFGFAQYSLWLYSRSKNDWGVGRGLLRLRFTAATPAAVAYCVAMLAAHVLGAHVLELWIPLVLVGNLLRQAWPDWVFVSAGRAWALSVTTAAAGALNVIAVLIWVRSSDDLFAAAVAYAISAALGLAALIQAAKAVSSTGESGVLTPQSSISSFKAAFPFGVGVMAGQLIAYVDVVVLNVLGRGEIVGVYSAAFRVVLVFQGLASAIQSVGLMAFTKLHVGERRSDSAKALRVTVALVGTTFTAIAVVLSLGSAPIVSVIFGSDFAAASSYLRLLAPLLPIDVVGAVALAQVTAEGGVRWSSTALVTGALTTVVLSFVLVPLFGASGAGFAKLAGATLVCVLSATRYERETRFLIIGFGVVLPSAAVLLIGLA